MYKVHIKNYVDDIFDGNINLFARTVGINYNPAKDLYLSKTTRINFDVLTALCNLFHCTPNDILIDDDIPNNKDITDNGNITDEEEDKALAAHLEALSKTIPNSMDIKSKEDARIIHLANKLILSYLQKITDSSDADGQKILESISKKSKEWEY